MLRSFCSLRLTHVFLTGYLDGDILINEIMGRGGFYATFAVNNLGSVTATTIKVHGNNYAAGSELSTELFYPGTNISQVTG